MGVVVEPFEEAFPLLLRRAFGVAYRLLGDVTLAEDASAEALARAHASWPKVSGLEYRDAWVSRVAANVAIDMARKRQRERLYVERRGAEVEPRILDTADAAVLRITLVAALARLPRRQREVVTLRYVGGLSEADIATALKISAGSVKKAMFRARETLRTGLGDGWEPASANHSAVSAL